MITTDLGSKSDLEWFDKMCEILKRYNNPTTKKIIPIVGTEKPNPDNEIRGSKFMIPYDKRFDSAFINPNISLFDDDRPIQGLTFYGENFRLKGSDVLQRFPNYKIQTNAYDGGSQIFFNPIPVSFEFTALSFQVNEEIDEINPKLLQLSFHNVKFHFGYILIQGMDGYSMKRG